MFEVTEKVIAMIKEAFKDKEQIPSIRIQYMEGGWSGPSLGMALDEPRDDDDVFTENGITYLINKGLYEQVKPIRVDFADTPMGSGFHVSGNSGDSEKSCGSCSC